MLLFAIAIEPLACFIRSSPLITGVMTGQQEERISLYADDMLLYLGDVLTLVPAAMDIIGAFGRWSGLLINWDKSVILPVDPLPHSFSPVSSRPSDFLELNLIPLLERLSSKVDTWCRLPLSVIGRGNLVKIIFMPQLLYILHNAPVWIPMYYFQKMNRIYFVL